MKNLVSNTAPTALLVAAGLAAVAFAQRSQAPAALPYPGALVPFVVEDDGGLANSGGPGTSNPQIIVDSDGAAGFFIINSILVEADAPQLGFEALSINQVRIDGVEFDARTGNLVGGIDGSGVVEAAELLGTPVRTTSLSAPEQETGGNFPHQITALNADVDDVRIRLFARSDNTDLDISKIRVTGWKRPNDEITLTYVEGD